MLWNILQRALLSGTPDHMHAWSPAFVVGTLQNGALQTITLHNGALQIGHCRQLLARPAFCRIIPYRALCEAQFKVQFYRRPTTCLARGFWAWLLARLVKQKVNFRPGYCRTRYGRPGIADRDIVYRGILYRGIIYLAILYRTGHYKTCTFFGANKMGPHCAIKLYL